MADEEEDKVRTALLGQAVEDETAKSETLRALIEALDRDADDAIAEFIQLDDFDPAKVRAIHYRAWRANAFKVLIADVIERGQRAERALKEQQREDLEAHDDEEPPQDEADQAQM